MVRLRELEKKDALLMLEWMHDPEIQKGFKKNMLGMTLEKAEKFCCSSKIPHQIIDGESIHFAIVNLKDEYLGTISLKDINLSDRTAEYAITTRRCAHGRGYAKKATGLLLKKAFKDYGLHRVYLNVFSDNIAAIKLYEKSGFKYEGEFREHFYINGEYKNWKWYSMLEDEFDEQLFVD